MSTAPATRLKPGPRPSETLREVADALVGKLLPLRAGLELMAEDPRDPRDTPTAGGGEDEDE